MRLLVSGATPAVKDWYARRPDRLGVLISPGKSLVTSMLTGEYPYACDNGCFKALDAPAWLRMLAAVLACPSLPLWVACPDRVGDAAETLRRFAVWGPAVRELGLRPALVGQDALTPEVVPWGGLSAYFVGGTDAWKLSRESWLLVREAKGRGLPVHMGRVNSLERITAAAEWGCDTIDGTGFTWYSDIRIPKAVAWIEEALSLSQEPRLFIE